MHQGDQQCLKGDTVVSSLPPSHGHRSTLHTNSAQVIPLQSYSPIYLSAAGAALDLSWTIHASEHVHILKGKQLGKFSKVLIVQKNALHWN